MTTFTEATSEKMRNNLLELSKSIKFYLINSNPERYVGFYNDIKSKINGIQEYNVCLNDLLSIDIHENSKLQGYRNGTDIKIISMKKVLDSFSDYIVNKFESIIEDYNYSSENYLDLPDKDKKNLVDQIDDTYINKLITKLLGEVQAKNFIVRYDVEIIGINLLCDKCYIGNVLEFKNLTLKKINNIENAVKITFNLYEEEMDNRSQYIWDVSDVLINIFNLYKLAAIKSINIDVKSISAFYPNFRIGDYSFVEDPSLPYNFYYNFDKTDIDNFKSFVNNLKSVVPLTRTFNESNVSYIDIAFNWYKEALLENIEKENRVVLALASSIISLEALYQNNEGELTNRLSQRVASLICRGKSKRVYGFEALKVIDNIRNAYNMRSGVVHGSIVDIHKKHLNLIKSSGFYSPKEFLKLILEYNRLSLLLFIQLNEKYTRKQIIKMLDDSLFDDSVRKSLEECIENCTI